MKSLLIGLSGIIALSLTATSVTWWVRGAPDRAIVCDPESLKAGEVCFSEVKEWQKDSYLWVDARPRKLWKKNGVIGSVLLTDDNEEDYMALQGNFMLSLTGGSEPYQRVVIYCNEEGCGSSKAIATSIRKDFGEAFGLEVYTLFGGWKALAAEGLTNSAN